MRFSFIYRHVIFKGSKECVNLLLKMVIPKKNFNSLLLFFIPAPAIDIDINIMKELKKNLN